jgi:phage-related minor tail protein
MASKIQIIIEALDKASGPISKVSGSLNKAGGEAKGANNQFATMAAGWAKAAFSAAAIGGAVLKLADYLQAAGKTAGRFAELNAQQAAILNATGNAAGFTASQLDKMARELSKVTEIQVSTIKQSQNMLLTFRNISDDVFPRAMQAAADLSTVFGGFESATLQLGKALNDPIQGINALNRAGVQFTKEQRETIKSLVEMGDVAAAQAIILEEVEKQVGGTSKAIAEAGDGSGRLKASLEVLSAEIGRGVLPMQQRWNKALADTIDLVAENIRRANNDYDSKQRALDVIQANRRELAKYGIQVRFTTEDVKHQMAVQDRQNAYMNLTTEQLKALGVQYYKTSDATNDYTEATEESAAALSKTNQEFLKLVGTMQSDLEKATKQEADFAAKRIELQKELEAAYKLTGRKQKEAVDEIIGKLDELSKAEADAAAETELASRRRILAMLEQRLAMDGLTTAEMEYLLELGLAWGVYSESAVKSAKTALAEVDRLEREFKNLPTSKTMTITINTIGGLPGMTSLSSQYAGQFVQQRAAGGPVSANRPYIVGEVGPELFVPSQSGAIVPNHAMGGASISIVYAPQMSFGTAAEFEQNITPLVEKATRKLQGFN